MQTMNKAIQHHRKVQQAFWGVTSHFQREMWGKKNNNFEREFIQLIANIRIIRLHEMEYSRQLSV